MAGQLYFNFHQRQGQSVGGCLLTAISCVLDTDKCVYGWEKTSY